MQVLNDWLTAVQADGMVLVRTRVAEPWGFAVPRREAVMFHFVGEGRAFVRPAGVAPFELLPGELVIFPRGGAHEMLHAAHGESIPVAEFVGLRNGVSDPAARASTLICGEFKLDRHLALPATRALPQVVHLRADSASDRAALTDTLRLLRTEVEAPDFGNQIVVRNLLSLLFVYFMRDWARTSALEAND